MVFDASKPIVRKGRRTNPQSSLESAMAEEAREVEALIAARSARGSGGGTSDTRPKDLESAFDFKITGRQSSMVSPMFSSRKSTGTPSYAGGDSGPGPMGSRDSRSRGASSLTVPTQEPRRASSPGPQPAIRRANSRSSGGDLESFKGAHRKLSEAILAQSSGTLASLPMSATAKEAIEKDRVTKDHDPEAAIESDSSDSNDESSDDEESSPDSSEHRNRRAPMSLAQAAENERMDVERSDTRDRLRKQNENPAVKHLIINDNSPSATRRKPIHPNTSYTDGNTGIHNIEDEDDDPYEDIKRDMAIVRSVSSEDSNRLICSLQRADYQRVHDASRRTRSYLVSVDLSPQAKYALEWTIGTVLRDGDTARIVHALDLSEREEKGGTATAQQMREDRQRSLEDICVDVNLFLKRTKLSVNIEIEVMHHHNPKHLITEIIDTTNPTMVIIGSRGRSNMSGIMLGSFSNYIVNKSSVPVMVARKRLRHGSKKRRIVPVPPKAQQFPNNLGTFSSVRLID